MTSINHAIWNKHYTRDRSKLTVPDENVVRFFHQNFDPEIKQTWLDLGCGSARHLNYLRQHGAISVGQDISLQALALNKIDNVICAKAEELPYKDNSFDFVISWGVMHYLPKGQEQIMSREMRRILKPNGKLFCSVRSNKDTHLKGVLKKGDLAGAHARFFNKRQLKKIFSHFQQVQFGMIARVQTNQSKKIVHHIVEALK